MDRTEQYKQFVEQIIKSYAQYKPDYGDIEMQTVLDRENGHFHLLTVGWHGNERIRGTILHIDVKPDKIWIQHDGTEIGVANELVEMGVPAGDIVLAYHVPYKRQHTGFAIA